jgi:hypothetical protein
MMDRQLALVLDGRPRPVDFSTLCDAEEMAVAQALRWGRECARQIPELATITGIHPRRVQEIVHHLVHRHHLPIGTAMSEPAGNYLIDTLEDLEHTVALLRMRGISNLARAAALKGMTVERFLRLIQTELPVEDGCTRN